MRIILTVVGKDKVGIIAMVTGALARYNVNIINLDQNIIEGFFNMILIADMKSATVELAQLQEIFAIEGEKMGVQIKVQHEGIFQAMHRI